MGALGWTSLESTPAPAEPAAELPPEASAASVAVISGGAGVAVAGALPVLAAGAAVSAGCV
jgi:hypothetical protein